MVKHLIATLEETRQGMRDTAAREGVEVDSLEYDWETAQWQAVLSVRRTLPPVSGNTPEGRLVDCVSWKTAVTIGHDLSLGDGNRLAAEAMFDVAVARLADVFDAVFRTGKNERVESWV